MVGGGYAPELAASIERHIGERDLMPFSSPLADGDQATSHIWPCLHFGDVHRHSDHGCCLAGVQRFFGAGQQPGELLLVAVRIDGQLSNQGVEIGPGQGRGSRRPGMVEVGDQSAPARFGLQLLG